MKALTFCIACLFLVPPTLVDAKPRKAYKNIYAYGPKECAEAWRVDAGTPGVSGMCAPPTVCNRPPMICALAPWGSTSTDRFYEILDARNGGSTID